MKVATGCAEVTWKFWKEFTGMTGWMITDSLQWNYVQSSANAMCVE